MTTHTALAKNLRFWHDYPELLVEGLTPAQLSWQPDAHDTSIIFAIWHAYRAEDELIHGLVMQRPSVWQSQSWAERLPVAETGATPFGNGLRAAANTAGRPKPARSSPTSRTTSSPRNTAGKPNSATSRSPASNAIASKARISHRWTRKPTASSHCSIREPTSGPITSALRMGESSR